MAIQDPKDRISNVLYVVMWNDYPVGAATTREAAERIRTECIQRQMSTAFTPERNPPYTRIYEFEDGKTKL